MDSSRLSSRIQWRRRLRTLLLTGAFVLTLLLVCVLKIASDGLPRIVVDALEESISSSECLFELEDVRVSFRRLYIGKLSLFPAHSFSASVEAQRVSIPYRWGLHKSNLIPRPSAIDIGKASLRSDHFFASTNSTASSPSPLPFDFGSLPISCSDLNAFGLPLSRLRTTLVKTPHGIHFDRIRFYAGPKERIAGELFLSQKSPSAPFTLTGHVSGTLRPPRANPVLRQFDLDDVADIFSDFELPSEPATIDIRFLFGEGKQFFKSTVSIHNFLYQSVPVQSASALISLENDGFHGWNNLRIQDLAVVRPEGRADADLFFDFARHGLLVNHATSTLDFPHLAKIIGILSGIPWNSFELSGGSRAEASGFVAFSAATEPTDLRGTLSIGQLSYKRRMPLQQISTSFLVGDSVYQFPDCKARLYDGEATGNARLHYDAQGDLKITSEVTLTQAKTALLSHDLFRRESPDDPGLADLQTQFEMNITTNELRSLTGTVSGKIRNARLYQTPLFAGFTDFMARNIPGIDFLVNQDNLDIEASLFDNGMHFSTLRVEGTLFTISGEGSYWFSDNLNLAVKIHLLRNSTFLGKLLKVALYPVSKLFEMEVKGPIRAPSWIPTTLTLSSRSEATDEEKYGAPPPHK